MANLKVTVAGVEFENPLIAASGTFGFGKEYSEFYPLSALGGVSCKGITIKERPGNPPPRVTEAPGGMLNAVGLQNPGVDHFIEYDLPWLSRQGTKIIANVAGNAPEDYCATVEKLNDTCVDIPVRRFCPLPCVWCGRPRVKLRYPLWGWAAFLPGRTQWKCFWQGRLHCRSVRCSLPTPMPPSKFVRVSASIWIRMVSKA